MIYAWARVLGGNFLPDVTTNASEAEQWTAKGFRVLPLVAQDSPTPTVSALLVLDEKSLEDAPPHYDHAEACAWADGYNEALAACTAPRR